MGEVRGKARAEPEGCTACLVEAIDAEMEVMLREVFKGCRVVETDVVEVTVGLKEELAWPWWA